MKPVVLFADRVHPDFIPEMEQRGFYCAEVYEGGPADWALSDEVRGAVHGVVIRSRFRLDASFLDHIPSLKWIARVGSGLENIDVPAFQQRHVHVFNAPYGLSNSVGEHALALLLAGLNHLVSGDREVRQGLWNRELHRGEELDGKTVGIWGFGATGSAFARKLRGFDVRILAYDPYKSNFSDEWVEQVPESRLFKEAEVVSLHVPLTDETRGMVDDAFFARFTRPIYFLNTSRGPVVRSAALLRALDARRVQFAGLDVLEEEGTHFESLSNPSDSWPALAAHPRILFSPHVAGWSVQSKWRMVEHLLEQIDGFYEEP